MTLQEKLDSLAINKSEQPKVEVCPVEPVEAKINECKLGQEKMEHTGGSANSDTIQSDGDKLLPTMVSQDKSKGEEALLSPSDNTPQLIVFEGNDRALRAESDLIQKKPDSEAIVGHKDEVRNEVPDSCVTELTREEVVNNAPELKQAGEVPAKEDENESDMSANSFKTIDGTRADDNLETLLDELPVNAIDDEDTDLGKDKRAEAENTITYEARSSEVSLPGDIEGLMATPEDAEMNELAELPIGAIDEDSASPVEVEENDNQPGNESERQSTTETTLADDEAPNEIGKTEEVREEKPMAETEESENQKFPVAATLEVETGQKEDREVEEHNEHSFLSESEELQPMISTADEQSHNALPEDECKLADAGRDKEVKEPQEMDAQCTNPLVYVSDEKLNEKLDGFEVANEEVSAGAELTPLQKSKSDKQLMEENEKLREMMEKLIEAGKQQLNVISNLNGRVKDLEKKLSSRTRKLRTKQKRSSACGVSRFKRSNVPAKDTSVGVAM